MSVYRFFPRLYGSPYRGPFQHGSKNVGLSQNAGDILPENRLMQKSTGPLLKRLEHVICFIHERRV